MAHMSPLPKDAHPELSETFETFERILGFVPNSLLTMQRLPHIVQGFEALVKAVMGPEGNKVDPGLKRLVAHASSRAAGCQYCQAHSLIAARIHDVSDEKVAAIWEYKTSPLYSEAERAAIDFGFAAGAVPNAVDEEIMARLREHWSDEEVVELLAAIGVYAFLNRWNDSLATDLEQPAKEMGERVLSAVGWDGGKHIS